MKKKKTISAALATALALTCMGSGEVLRSQCPCLMLTCRLWQVRFSKSTILLILQLLPRLLPHKPMRLKAGLLIPTSLRATKSWRWQTVGCTSSPLPLTVMRQRNPSSKQQLAGSSRMGHRLRLLQGRLLPRHHQIPAGRLRQPLRLLPGLQSTRAAACSFATIRAAGSGRPTPVAVAAAGTAVLVSLLRAPTKSTTFRSPGPTAKVATLTVDGQKAFDVDYSAMTNLSNKLAIKAAPGRS